MNEEKFTIERLVSGSFVKYERLSELIQYSFYNSTATEINIFIDLLSCIKRLYSIDAWGYKYSSKYELSASVINMCGHYREFFRRLGVRTKFYIIFGLNSPSINQTFVKNYNHKFISDFLNKENITKMISNNIQCLNLLCPYLPGIYFYCINDNEVSSMIVNILKNIKPIEANLVISSDPSIVQLIPEYNIRILRPFKTSEKDESFIVDNSNMWNMYFNNYTKTKVPNNSIGNGFIQNIIPMSRLEKRSMKSVFSINSAYQKIYRAVQLGLLKNDQLYSQSAINTVLEVLGVQFNPTELEMRYKAVNPDFQYQYILLNTCPEYRQLSFPELEDINSLSQIITNYFTDIPIDLEKL